MKLRMSRAIAGYILAGITMLALLLYLRFPGETVKDYVKAVAAIRYPEMLISINTVIPTMPPGVGLVNVTAGFRGRPPEATLHADRLSIRPGWLSLFRGRLAFLWSAEGYGGEARGRVDYKDILSRQGPFLAEANFREIRIEKCAWLRDAMARQITGTLKGSVSFNGVAETQPNRTGTLDFTLTNGTYQLLESFFGFEKLDFNKVDAKISFRNGALKIAGLTLNGEKLRCSLKGNILLADDLRDSQIDLNGTIEIPMQSNRRVTLAISGTLGNPKTRFL
jgi:type II secretion system protein N